MIKDSARAALRSPLGLLILFYGAFALFNLIRPWYGIELAAVVVRAIEVYRNTVSWLIDSSIGLTGLVLSPRQQDFVVLWVSIGRIVSRSYVLLNEETLHPDFEYAPFARLPFVVLMTVNRWFGKISRGRAYWLGVALTSLVTGTLWPLFLWTLSLNPTVTKRERWRVYTGGTSHPADRRMTELPPVGDELKPKFSKEESTTHPRYNAVVIILTYLVVQALCVGLVVAGNLALLSIT